MFFNASDGYAEAFLRGLRKGFLTETNYNVIRNSHSLKDLKTVCYKINIKGSFRY
jgi:hypothetical protein